MNEEFILWNPAIKRYEVYDKTKSFIVGSATTKEEAEDVLRSYQEDIKNGDCE